jgi:hypothetical protein
MQWGTFLLCSSITLSLYFFHVFLKLIVASVQRTSVWSLACVIPSCPLPGISSGYQTYDAYANIAQTHANNSAEVVSSARKRIYWDDPLRLSVPYQYFQELSGEPPDNAFLAILFFLSVIAIYVTVLGVRLWMLRAESRNASSKQSSIKKVALTSRNAKEGTDISCSFDTDGIFF